ncbi:MAG: hypothetical protein A2136_03990 [Chloroflexi bacterium RBG_16_54_11]|nr:MAG: hypothetical protein A2136_03990 [Chloroflexi bacterium RBG_16_54_11]
MPDWLSTSIFWVTLVVMGIGLLGLIVPIFPGLTIIWLASLGYGVVTSFTTLGWVLFVVLTILFIGGALIDNILMGAKAHREGATWSTLTLGYLAGIIGTIAFPPIGGILAAPLVILLLEYRRQGDFNKALLSLRGLAVGWGLSFVVRLFIGAAMIGLWLVWALNR